MLGMSSCQLSFTEISLTHSSFGQEQAPIAAIQAVTSGGNPGEAATLAGASISLLLAAANPCAKVRLLASTINSTVHADMFDSSQRLMRSSPNLVLEQMLSQLPRASSQPSKTSTLSMLTAQLSAATQASQRQRLFVV